jgi:phage-related protein
MPFATFNPPIAPSPGTSQTPKINIHEAEFGDGYSQPTAAGLNHIRREIQLKWDALTLSQKNSINNFFTGKGGYTPFYYQIYGDDSALKWTCKEWTVDSPAGYWTISATFVQSFALD